MALPVILIDSGSGSDTQASGAGPSTALFGTTDASTDGAGTTVTVTAGTDLTNVATDGSHVIFLSDATAGKRNFGKITGKAGSGGATPTVTVSAAFALSASGLSWAIGGKRATLSGTTSKKLIENNSSTGDAQAGWAVEFQSGSTDSFSAAQRIQVTGDVTNGYFEIRGVAGAGTMPIITCTANSRLFDPAAFVRLKDLEFRNTNATKTTSCVAEHFNGTGPLQMVGLKVTHSTNKFTSLIAVTTNAAKIGVRIESCEIANCNGDGIFITGTGCCYIVNCYIHNNGGDGIELSKTFTGSATVVGNIVASNSAAGINVSQTGSNAGATYIAGNTVYNNTGSGILLAANTSLGNDGGCGGIYSNICSSNGAYGVSLTAGNAALITPWIQNNNTYNNTSGQYNPAGLGTGDPGLDPVYTNAGGGDFSIGTNLKAKGYPLAGSLTVGTFSGTSSYVDIGAAQRQEAGGGSGGGANLIGNGTLTAA